MGQSFARLMILNAKEAASGAESFDDYKLSDVKPGVKVDVLIREGHSETGKTSITFLVHDKDGNVHSGTLTANVFDMVVGGFRGALQRFGK